MYYIIVYENKMCKSVEVESIQEMQAGVNLALHKKALSKFEESDQPKILHVGIDFFEIRTIEQSKAFFSGIQFFKNYLFNK